jgi:hypothetical protein
LGLKALNFFLYLFVVEFGGLCSLFDALRDGLPCIFEIIWRIFLLWFGFSFVFGGSECGFLDLLFESIFLLGKELNSDFMIPDLVLGIPQLGLQVDGFGLFIEVLFVKVLLSLFSDFYSGQFFRFRNRLVNRAFPG